MRITLDAVRTVGSGLNRPECAVAHSSGLLFAPDWTDPGGVAVIAPDGRVSRILATAPDPRVDLPVRPNGIALEPGGTFLLAHLGPERGGLYRLYADGRCETVADQVDGRPLPPANFPMIDPAGRIWLSVSTTIVPRGDDYRPTAATGFVALLRDGALETRADGLGYANECAVADAAGGGETFFVNETFGRRLTAFDLIETDAGPRLENRRTVAAFGPGTYPDGMALAADGSIWITSIVSNRVIRVDPATGAAETVIEDVDPDHLAAVEAAFQDGTMGRPHLDNVKSARLASVSNLAFGGPDLRTAYLGCLLGDAIAVFDAPVAGLPPRCWRADLGPLARYLDA